MLKALLYVLMLVAAVDRIAEAQASDYGNTRFPLLLVHGMAGTDSYLGVMPYWYGHREVLSEHGVDFAFAALSSFAPTSIRGEQLREFVHVVQAHFDTEKVNMLGHSHGGAAMRYVASKDPQHVASITAIGAPMYGTELADAFLSKPRKVPGLLIGLMDMLGVLIGGTSGSLVESDAQAQIEELSTDGMAAFNVQYPSAGLAGPCNAGAAKDIRMFAGEIHEQYLFSYTGDQLKTNRFDLSDRFVSSGDEVIPGANDGRVSVCSSKFGRDLGVYPWNHLDEVNQLFGLRKKRSPNPVYVMLNQANRLKQLGL